MSLTVKQKKWIDKNKKRLSIPEMSKVLGVEEKEIEQYIHTEKSVAPKIKRKKSPLYFYFILVLIPILFFVLLEIGLRVFDYGYNTEQWIEITENKMMLNPDVAKKYFFATKASPNSIQDVFDKTKAENAFRVFVLGGSSAAGYPYMPLGSFSRYLQKRLELIYPKSKIEVVNLSMTAVNSFTILDFMPGIVEQKPDLILIYAGHNEYYGALGAGSLESLGSNREVIKIILYLNKFRTVQLIRNLVQKTAGTFAEGEPRQGTLMARIAREQTIPFESKKYFEGLKQFELNMRSVASIAEENNIPLLLGTVTSNLKDQPPFISVNQSNFPPAETVFENAEAELKFRNLMIADSLFRYAKELDALRFRAPGRINKIIRDLSIEFNIPVVPIDERINQASEDNIVGEELMTDHLHLTLNGYQLIGDYYFDLMTRENLLPKTKALDLSDSEQDSLTRKNFVFSKLDSTISDFRIKYLRNDYPFKQPEERTPVDQLFIIENYIDSLAAQVVFNKMDWTTAERKAANFYLKRNNIDSFLEIIDVLDSQYPFLTEHHDFAAKELLKREMYEEVYPYLKKRYSIEPNQLTAKWIGIIDLSNEKYQSAEKFLKESLTYVPDDAQVLYNLSGALAQQGKIDEAIKYINRTIEINPEYPRAKQFRNQLKTLMEQKRN